MSLRTITQWSWKSVCGGFRRTRDKWRKSKRRWGTRMCARMRCSIGISCGSSKRQPLLHPRQRKRILAGVGNTTWRKLDGAFDGSAGVARGAVGAAGRGRRSYQAHDMQKAFRFEWLGHADDGAELVAGGVVGGLG